MSMANTCFRRCIYDKGASGPRSLPLALAVLCYDDRRTTSNVNSLMRRVSNVPVHSKVYDQLKNAIMAGEFKPGEAVTIRDLADKLGVSNTPVREALRRLIAEHALESLPNRSVRVPELTKSDVANIVKARVLVEGEAAFLAARNVSKKTIESLKRIKKEEVELAGKGDRSKLKQNNQRFHFTLYEACGNPVLFAMIQPLWLRYASLFSVAPLLLHADRKTGCYPRHSEVLNALKSGEPEAVRDAVISDITDGTKAEGFWDELPG